MPTSYRQRARGRMGWATVGLLAWLGAPGFAGEPTLHKILDSTDPVPGAPEASWEGFRPFFDVVADGGEIAFIGYSREPSGIRDGVYRRRGDTLERIADSRMVRPGTGLELKTFWRVAMDDGVVAFTSEDRDERVGGVYRYDGAGLSVVADHSTQIPGAEPARFVSFGDVALHRGTVLFGAGITPHFAVWFQDGLYLAADGVLARLIDSSTPVPGGAGTFDLVGEVGLGPLGFSFAKPRPDVTVNDGIYRNLGDGLEAVVDLSTIAPHTGTPFQSFRAVSHDGATVAFNAYAGDQGAVYLHDGALRTIATLQTPFPGSGRSFAGFSNRIATSRGRVAFMGWWNPPGQPSRTGLLLADGPELTLIAEVGAPLEGRVVQDIDLSEGGFDWPNLYFTVSFEDGGAALYRLNALGVEEELPPPGPWLTSPALEGFRVKARITGGGSVFLGQEVTPCVAETLCVSGARPDRAELLVRVVGPKPNGKLWPTLVKFSTSRVEVWIEQTARGVVRYYDLSPVAPGAERLELDGLADKVGFDP